MKIDLSNGLWNGTIGFVLSFVIGLVAWSNGLDVKPFPFMGLIWMSLIVFILMGISGAIIGNFTVEKDEQ